MHLPNVKHEVLSLCKNHWFHLSTSLAYEVGKWDPITSGFSTRDACRDASYPVWTNELSTCDLNVGDTQPHAFWEMSTNIYKADLFVTVNRDVRVIPLIDIPQNWRAALGFMIKYSLTSRGHFFIFPPSLFLTGSFLLNFSISNQKLYWKESFKNNFAIANICRIFSLSLSRSLALWISDSLALFLSLWISDSLSLSLSLSRFLCPSLSLLQVWVTRIYQLMVFI